MVAQKDKNVLNKFSLDEEGNLAIAKWSTTRTEYTYQNEAEEELSEEDKAKILEQENIRENVPEELFISISKIEYKQYITKYIANYGLLSDLLVITDNVDFCLELAELAFNSKIVINVKEELTTIDTTVTTDYTQTTLLYDYVNYIVSGEQEQASSNWVELDSGDGSPYQYEEVWYPYYGWDSEQPSTTIQGSSNGISYIYNWSWIYNDVEYKLDYIFLTNRSTKWVLYKKEDNVEYEDITLEQQDNYLINLDGNHITEAYENYTIDENYTDSEIFKYTEIAKTYSESNRYDFEISEVDTWYLKYHKQYKDPTSQLKEHVLNPEPISGQYTEELQTIVDTNDEDQIEDDEHVDEFITDKENKYNNVKNVSCDVTNLVVKQRYKTDSDEYYESTTITYNFGEESADTTPVHFKNVEYNNAPSFTNENEEGFLSIYDKYRQNGVDLYLQDDAEKRLFALLEGDSTTSSYSNVIKYLLYVYDGIDRGVTDLQLTIIDLDGFKGVKGSSTENFIKAWENASLWAYESGQSVTIPTQYLTEDGLCYIVYEDGSAGHNNIAYGWATFITSSENVKVTHPIYGQGYYNWKAEFEAEGIVVDNLYEGAYVDKAIADAVFQNEILPRFQTKVEDYLAEHLPEYEFSQPQKDALTSICYQYGNIIGFADAYRSSLDESGTLNAEQLKENYSRFNYSGSVNDRKYANWLLFTQEKYIDRTGNIIEVGPGTIVEAAYVVANHFMNSGVDVHYAGNDVKGSNNNGRSCIYNNIQGSWDRPIEEPDKYGVVCATFVSLSIWQAGLIDEETINHYGYNSVAGVENMLMNSEYSNQWEVITNFDELQEGDIVSVEGHIFIFVDEMKCLDQAYCVIGSRGTDSRGVLTNASYYRSTFRYGFRYIG